MIARLAFHTQRYPNPTGLGAGEDNGHPPFDAAT